MGRAAGFLEVNRLKQPTRPVAERLRDWREVYQPYEAHALTEQRPPDQLHGDFRPAHALRAAPDQDDGGELGRDGAGRHRESATAPRPCWRVRERACYASRRSAIGGRPLQVVARSRARKRRELRQVRKEAAVPTPFLCRGGA